MTEHSNSERYTEDSLWAANAKALLPEIIHANLGSGVSLGGYTVIKSDHEYMVVDARLEYPASRVIVKMAGPSAALECPFDRTAALHSLIRRQTNVPVAEVLAADVSYEVWPVRYLVKTWLPGVEWAEVHSQMDQRELRQAHSQIGQAVAELHGLRFSSFGELIAGSMAIEAEPYLEAFIRRSQRRIANEPYAKFFAELVNERAGLFASVAGPCLCHEDLHGYNMLFDKDDSEWRLSAILDFDSAWAGHHESDLARLELWRGMVGEGFWGSYRAIHAVDEGYLQRRPIHQLLWCLEYNSTSPQHLADTRRVCSELGIASPLDDAQGNSLL